MNRYIFQAIVWMAFVVLALPQSLPAMETSRDFYWQADNGERLHGLYVMKVEERAMVSRILAMTPSGPVLLTGLLDPIEGSMTTRFLDPTSGWWAELKMVDDLQATSLDHYFQIATREYGPQSHRSITFSLATSNGIEWVETLAYAEPSKLHRELAAALERQHLSARLPGEIPSETIRSLLFLHRWLSPTSLAPGHQNFAHGLRPVLEVLSPLLENHLSPTRGSVADQDRQVWELNAGPLTTDLLSPDRPTRAVQLELLSQFEDVENTDPLSDLRDLFLLKRPEVQPR